MPPLPSVASVLGPGYGNFSWRRDPNYATESSFEFTNLDRVRHASRNACHLTRR